jgi:hypothetical protein
MGAKWFDIGIADAAEPVRRSLRERNTNRYNRNRTGRNRDHRCQRIVTLTECSKPVVRWIRGDSELGEAAESSRLGGVRCECVV